MSIELINGSWIQTIANILKSINEKLENEEIDNIIRRIDESISDEEILELLNLVFTILKKVDLDLSLLNERITVLENELLIRNFIVIREVILNPKYPKINKKSGIRLPYKEITKIEKETTFIIDQKVSTGYMEQVIELIPGGYKYLPGFWLIDGNRRKLISTDEYVLNKYGLLK
jgi:hypothetical protein